MSTLRQAAEQALEALEAMQAYAAAERKGLRICDESITALRAALAQQAEPVAWMVYTLDGQSAFVTDNPADFTPEHRALPLYTAPPKRNPLTAPQIHELDWPDDVAFEEILEFVRAIERAHGIGGEE